MESQKSELEKLMEDLLAHQSDPMKWRESNPEAYYKRTRELEAQIAELGAKKKFTK